MMLGQAAGTAAALAADQEIAVQELSYATLHARLIQDGMILDLPAHWLHIITHND